MEEQADCLTSQINIEKLYSFYLDELKNNILKFWIPKCIDTEYGGVLNCYTNDGTKLVSTDKYTWSQGRFLYCLSRMVTSPISVDLLSAEEKTFLLKCAGECADFLMKHCLIGENDYRCIFLLEKDGSPKQVYENAPLDMSIYADCFVVSGLSMYSVAASRPDIYVFAKKLYESILQRVKDGRFNTLPYPLSKEFRAHGIPMILSNTTRELIRGARAAAPDDIPSLLQNIEAFSADILDHFVDDSYALHEIITADNQFFPQILGQHINPGHTLEDAWFLFDAVDLCARKDFEKKIYGMVDYALETGWDSEFGGLYHFSSLEGGEPKGDRTGVENEAMTIQLNGWGDKLWWVHSEALYTTLLCYFRTGGDEKYWKWYQKVHEYTFRVFPNTDRTVGEWIQIRRRDGTPEDKVVALPVKDPYHIMRDLILILELLYNQLH